MKKLLALFFTLCLTFGQSVFAATTADVIFVVDESGSMGGEHSWIGNMVNSLDSALNTAGVTGNRFGLIGYGGSSRHGISGHGHDVGGVSSLYGTSTELATATGSLVTSGSTEDGYEAINFAFNNYSFRQNAAVNFVLVTDEDRDTLRGQSTLNSAQIQSLFNGRGALLNAVVDTRFSNGNASALGVDSNGNAYTADGAGGFNTSSGGFATRGSGSTIQDYVDLAFLTGGAGWDLNQLRAGGNIADSFTQAFVDIKVNEIINQPVDPVAAVPVPAAVWLFGSGLIGLLGMRKKSLKV